MTSRSCLRMGRSRRHHLCEWAYVSDIEVPRGILGSCCHSVQGTDDRENQKLVQQCLQKTEGASSQYRFSVHCYSTQVANVHRSSLDSHVEESHLIDCDMVDGIYLLTESY